LVFYAEYHMKSSNIAFLVLLSFFYLRSDAQIQWVDSLSAKMDMYHEAKSAPVLFAHFDKTIYIQNENVWFTCYLLTRTLNDDPDILSVALVNDLDKSVALKKKFVMAAGIAFGNIFLTDSIAAGNYSFFLYTNQLSHDNPGTTFIQHITVLRSSEPTVSLSMSVDSSTLNTNEKKVFFALTRDERPLKGVRINYFLGDKTRPLLSGEAKTNDEGRYVLLLPLKLPGLKQETLSAQVKLDDGIHRAEIPITFQPGKMSVKFFPEGGYLVHAIEGWVGIETTSINGEPFPAIGVLFKDNHPIDTVITDSYGMGRFKLSPLIGSRYSLKLLNSKLSDSIFILPSILTEGPAISINRALVDDSLILRVTTKKPEAITVVIHNFQQIFYAFPAKINAPGKTFLINMKSIPKGLATVTLIDSLKRPCAERMFFAHYDKSNPTLVQTDKSNYSKREKVTLSLKLMLPDTGLVSVACVQSNRVLIKQSNDIESYAYLQQELGTLPLKEHYMGKSEEDRRYLENILLIKGWRKYKWQEMMEIKAADTNKNSRELVLTGKVTRFGEPLKKPVRIVVMTDSLTSTIKTDKAGYFELPNTLITTAEGKKVRLLLLEKDLADYKININDPFTRLTDSLVKDLPASTSMMTAGDNQFVLKGLNHTIALKEVKITAKKDNNYSSSSAATLMPTENECGDYICMFGIFNCPNHVGFANNIIPTVGQYYMIRGRMTRYMGCIVPIVKNKESFGMYFQGINISKEFYGSDYSIVNPSQPELISTIFWKHLSVISSAKPIQLSFYCSDITGLFKVVVQGITRNDVTYGETYFSVK